MVNPVIKLLNTRNFPHRQPISTAVVLATSLLMAGNAVSASFKVGENGWLIDSQGQNFLPVGIYSVPKDESEAVSAYTNVIANPFWATDVRGTKSYLSQYESLGLFGIVGFDEIESNLYQSNLNSDFIADYISNFKNREGLLAYYLPDEPIGRPKPIPLKTLKNYYTIIKQADPDSVVVMTDFKADAPTLAKDFYDIYMYDFYPIGTASIAQYRNLIREMRVKVSPKPLWAALQAYANGGDWKKSSREELRAMAYVALINGAKGLIAYQHCSSRCGSAYIKNHPQMWENLQELNKEILVLSKVFTAPESNAVNITEKVDGMDAIIKRLENKYYIIVVNWASLTVGDNGRFQGIDLGDVMFSLTGITNGEVKIVAGEGVGKRISLSGGTFKDNLGPYSTKVYEIVETKKIAEKKPQPPNNLRLL